MSREVGVSSRIVCIKLDWLGFVFPASCGAGIFEGKFGCMRYGVVGEGRGFW